MAIEARVLPLLVSCADLLDAFYWVSSRSQWENAAYISRETGATFWTSTTIELEEEIPDDLDDGSRYLAVPHMNQLELGRSLVLRFVDQALPDSHEVVSDFFQHVGAYRRFKDFLDGRDLLQTWYDFEGKAAERVLREWAEEHGLQLQT